MTTDTDFESRVRGTLRDVAATTVVSEWPVARSLEQAPSRRYRPIWVAAASFLGVIVAIGVAVAVVDSGGSGEVATGPLPPPQSCDATAYAPASFVVGTATDINPSLLFLPTHVAEGLSLDKAWSTNGGLGCLSAPAFSLVSWDPNVSDKAEIVIQVQHGFDFDSLEHSGPPPGDHVFDVIDYGEAHVIGYAAGEVPVTVRHEGVSLDETMELLDRVIIGSGGNLQIDGGTGPFEFIPGADVEPVSQVLPLHNWYVGGESDEQDLLNLWFRFEPGFTPASHLRNGAEVVDIDGIEGVLYQYPEAGPVDIEWEIAPGVVAFLHTQHVDIPRDELLKMAESVQPITTNDPAIPPPFSDTNG